MSARWNADPETVGAMRPEAGEEKNSRRYAGESEADRAAHRRAGDLFPEARVDPLADIDQRFTTRETDAWCRKHAGVTEWDLDVAACEESHLAKAYFTKVGDGLLQSWSGRVWCNPPFSDIEPWVKKAWAEMADDRGPTTIAMLLPASRTEQAWWQSEVEPWRDLPRDGNNRPMCPRILLATTFLPGRTRFGHPGNPDGVGVGSPPFGCVLLVWRRA